MAKKIPQTLYDAINEEPERFLSYLSLDRIFKAKNPYQEFLLQFKKVFGSLQGLNLWQYVLDRYALLNQLYKEKEVQKGIPINFRGPLNRKETKLFFDNYKDKSIKQQGIRDIKIKKPILVKNYIRKGISIKAYSKTRPNKYTDRQSRFIISRKDYPIKQLTNEFNRAFGTSVTSFGIRDKKLRLLGKKR